MSGQDRKPDVKPDIKPSLPSTDIEEQLRLHPNVNENKTWAFKIPRELYAKWEQVKEGGVELGTLVIDNSSAADLMYIVTS
jgi:transcription initiation factor TFIIF subunit beta